MKAVLWGTAVWWKGRDEGRRVDEADRGVGGSEWV